MENNQLAVNDKSNMEPVVAEIRELIAASRQKVVRQVNDELLITYWKIGEIIVKYEQNEQIRAAYGEKTLLQLSKSLTRELGKGFSRSNLQNMRSFYFEISNLPVSDWQIDMDTLLRTLYPEHKVNFRSWNL